MIMWFVLVVVAIVAYLAWKCQSNKLRVDDVIKKCVFITGCDSGFGQALARRLDSIGVPVFAGCLTKVGAETLHESATSRLKTVNLDVTDPESVSKAYEYVKDNLPLGTVLWGVVNNAGVRGTGGPFEFTSRKEFYDVMAVNFLGAADVTSTFHPLLRKSKGRIVNMASVAGFIPFHPIYAYTASKFAMFGFTECLRLEQKLWGIKVSCIEPALFRTGIIGTESHMRAIREQWQGLPEETRQHYGEEYLEETIAELSKTVDMMAKSNLSPVVDAYEHALFARRPRPHYLPGWEAKVMLVIGSLPGCLRDLILSLVIRGPLPKSLRKQK